MNKILGVKKKYLIKDGGMSYSDLGERDVETVIDHELKYLGWNDDPKNIKDCNVYKQRAKTKEQEKLLGKKRPDYILYRGNSDEPIAIIEAKKPHQDIDQAQEQAIKYAKILKTPIVFSTDGIYTKTFHMKKQSPLILNKEEVDELLSQSTLLNFLQDNIYSTNTKVIESREELICIFKKINNDLRKMGIKGGLDRIDLFSNILFLKIISELAEMGDEIVRVPPKNYLWDNFKNKKGLDLVDFLNKQAFDYFKESYGGEVLSKIEILSGKENILNNIIRDLDDLWLSDTSTDIKGDAFEYFLRNYGGAETDFGEYFTPRHIVKTMVRLLNPQFGEKVYDGFCGTGGMLTESFKYIKRRMPLNQTTIKQLKNETVYGGEFTTMFRVAKMNMILAGDGHSNIVRQDSYEKKQTNKFDVVITNIPFGVKMKTDYLPQYGYNGQSAEVCGVLHCLDALTDQNPNARAAIIVPEGILFNSNKAYTQLRRDLTEKYSLENIISLPKGAFIDASIKSDILIIKKTRNTLKGHIWYFDLQNDGLTLNKSRKKIHGKNDIDVLLSERNLKIDEIERLKKINFDILYKNQLKINKYIFLINHYKEQIVEGFNFDSVQLKELSFLKDIEFLKGKGLSKSQLILGGKNKCILYGELYTLYKSPFINEVLSKTNISNGVYSQKGDVLVPATTTADANGIAIARSLNLDNVIIGGDINIIRIYNQEKINPSFLSITFNYPLKNRLSEYARGANILHLYNSDIKNIKIPLPSIKDQNKIVKLYKEKQILIEETKKKVELLENEIKEKTMQLFLKNQ